MMNKHVPITEKPAIKIVFLLKLCSKKQEKKDEITRTIPIIIVDRAADKISPSVENILVALKSMTLIPANCWQNINIIVANNGLKNFLFLQIEISFITWLTEVVSGSTSTDSFFRESLIDSDRADLYIFLLANHDGDSGKK